MSESFKDHFSARAAEYAAFRPTYPPALFEWLGGLVARHGLVWDCATGNGQAVGGLAPFFERVIATDASDAQIANARPFPNVEYRIARAESSGLGLASVDLVTVAQAMHWINRPLFYREVRRVVRPGGAIAVWSYALVRINPAIDAVVDEFESTRVGPFWPPERALVDAGYRTIEFPFRELEAPRFVIGAEWALPQFAGYVGSWSAVERYKKATGRDPVEEFLPRLAKAWGDPELTQHIEWPLNVRAGVV